MGKIRSIQVVNVRWFNATAWYGLYLSSLLRGAGHETLVLALPGTATFRKAEEWGLEPLALPLNSLGPLELPRLHGRLARLLGDFKPQLVNCHRGESFALWGLLKRRGGYALVRTRGDRRPPKNNLPNRLLHKRAADAVIATNSGTARDLIAGLGLAPEKVFTVLGGVDTGRFYPDKAAGAALRASLGIAPEEFVLGLLGRLDPVKGHEVLIRAAGEAQRARPERRLRLLCIGADSHLSKADLEGLAERAGLGGSILVTGRVDKVADYINALDLGVLASVGSEAIARAALEIMACQVPLLSSDVGVMPDLLPREELAPVHDAGALARGIVKGLDDPAWLERLRASGRAALAGLTPEAFLRQTLQVYAYALEKSGRVSPDEKSPGCGV